MLLIVYFNNFKNKFLKDCRDEMYSSKSDTNTKLSIISIRKTIYIYKIPQLQIFCNPVKEKYSYSMWLT